MWRTQRERLTAFGPNAHEDPHDPRDPVRARRIDRTLRLCLAVNALLVLAQLAVGLAARSQALVADALHTLSDVLGDGVALVASRLARAEADAEHPYGHRRFETAATLGLGVLLVAVALGLLLSALDKILAPNEVAPVAPAAVAMAVATLVSKEALFRYVLSVGRRTRSNLLIATAWHARSDAASSLVVAFGVAGSMAGYPILDPIAALVVGLLIVRIGGRLAWNALADLMDRAADASEIAAIRATLEATPGVRAVHDLRTRKTGDLLEADVHLEVDADLSVEAGHDIAVEARRRVLERHRVVELMVHIDPWRRPDRDHAPHPSAPTPDARQAQ
ncbi:MAG: cation diffusion facilitator family transporter [Casimicrobiaceae bacterium]|nr:cation diffusion facilitator family transporter [Casimicrobiaceae bacterium]